MIVILPKGEAINMQWMDKSKKKIYYSLCIIILIYIGFYLIINLSNRPSTDDHQDKLIQSRGINVKLYGAKGDGHSDDTEALKAAFNSNSGDLYFPKGIYKVTSTINVAPGKPKHVSGEDNVVISAKLEENKNLFELRRNISFKNLTFDFNNGSLNYGLFFKENLGKISLSNLVFKNIKDLNSSSSTIIVYILTPGNRFQIKNIDFTHIKKKGNGIYGDGGGNITCLYITDSGNGSGAIGQVKGIKIKNVHNIDPSNNITYEDSSGIYIITGKNDRKNDIKLDNIYGYNFGKRLIKLHASNIKVNHVFAYSDTNDAVSAIGVNSGLQPGEKVNTIITNVTIRGRFSAALATAGEHTTFRNIDIKIQKPTLINNDFHSYGVLITGENATIEKAVIKAERPIFSIDNNGKLTDSVRIKNTKIETIE